jgi:hypothetical protein
MKGNRFMKKKRLTKAKRLTINFGDLKKAEKLNLDYHIKNGRVIWEKDNILIARALAVEYLLDNGKKLTTVKIGTVKEICDYFNHTDITGFEEVLPSSLKKMLTNRGFKIIDCKWVKPQEVFANAKTIENYHLY